MGTGARDDINIGVGIEAIPGSEAVADRVNGKLREVRREAQSLAKDATASASANNAITVSLEEGRAAWARAQGDMAKFRQELAKIVAARTALESAPVVPSPVAPGAAAAVDKVVTAVEALDEAQRRAATAPTIPLPGVGPAAGPRVGPQVFPVSVGPIGPQLGPEVPERLGDTALRAAAVTTEINLAIGALGRMGQSVDVTNRAAVQAFGAESQAAAAYLAKLGATDAELKIIASTLTQLERRSGAASVGGVVPNVPPVQPGTIASYDRLGGRLRTAANATAILGQAAVVGTGSIAGMGAAAGNVALGLGAFATGGVGIAVAAIGAVVTVVFSVVELFKRWREETDKEKVSLGELNQKMLEGGKSTAIQAILNQTETQLVAARAERARLESAARQAPPATATFGPGGGAVSVSSQQRALDAAKENVARLEAQQTALNLALVKHAQDAAKEVEAEQRKAADESVRIATERTQGEFAARRVAIEQEFAEQKRELLASGADQSKISATLTALEQKRAQDLITLEHDRNLKLTTLRRQAAGELLVVQTEQLDGEVAAQKTAIEVQLQDKIAGITAEVGLEGVRGVRIAAARAEAAEKIRKIEVEQERKRADLQRAIEADIADAQTGGRSELDRAIEAANRKREERQREIDKVSVGDAEATANERNELELQADEARNAAIAAARRTHSEELKKISQDTENAILELTGRSSDARRNIINQEIDERIKKARQLKAPESKIQGLEQERGLRLSGVDFDDLRVKGTKALDELDSDLQRTQALAVSGAISERQARDQVVDAYERARAEIEKLLPALEQIEAAAKAGGDAETVRGIEQLKTKYLQLGNTLSQLRDTFARLKQTARESTTDALAGIFEGATKLGTQDTSQIRALSDQLRGARQELDELLSTPSGRRTAQQNDRITALRSEIEQTSVSLDSAKQSITTWRDLFINAAQAVVDALIRVSAQMLATSLITSALGLFGGGGGRGDDGLTGATTGRAHFATGGPVDSGPSGVDAVPANLTRGEFVQPQPTVELYGAQFQEAQRRRLFRPADIQALMDSTLRGMRSINLRPRVGSRWFAEGGLVSAGEVGSRGSGGQVFTHIFNFRGLPAGTTLEHVDSPEGHRVIVQIISDHANAVNAGLGRLS